jgi:hypothetical protein
LPDPEQSHEHCENAEDEEDGFHSDILFSNPMSVRNGWKRTFAHGHFTKTKTARMATLEMIDVVHPMAFEWLHPDAATATKRPIIPIEKLMPSRGRIAAVERAAVAGGASGCEIAIKALEAITATMNDTAATADP